MSDESALSEIVTLALKWRYSHPSDAQFSHVQQFEDGRELIEILRKHGVEIPMDFAMKEIPAPAALPYDGTCSHGKLNREFCKDCHPRPATVIPTVVRG
jgi:hypothetical protein